MEKMLKMGYTVDVKKGEENDFAWVFYPSGCFAFCANVLDVDVVGEVLGLVY